MKQKSLAIFIFFVLHLSAFAEEPDNCRSALSTPSVAESSCEADAETCDVWHRFRRERPYPYQAISMMDMPGSGRATLIFSELPPLGGADQMARLLQAVFGVEAHSLHRLRYPVGLDGWLEDWVLTVPYESGKVVEVAEAHGGTIQMPFKLAEQLQFLNTAVFGAPGMLYVDVLTGAGTQEVLPNLQITTGELLLQAAAVDKVWQPLLEQSAPPRAFGQLVQSSPALFTDKKRLLVALAIPPSTELSGLRSLFRQFSLNADYILSLIHI